MSPHRIRTFPEITAPFAACAIALFVAGSATASDSTFRSPVAGLEMKADLILDSVTLIDGGVAEESAMLGKAALMLDLNTRQARLWDGGRVHLQVLGTFGDEPSSMAGDLQVFDNIEAGERFGVLEAWIEQSLGTRASLLVGYHDLNREFDVIESAGELINSSFGIGPEISQIGPSIFPETHLGVRLELRPTNTDGYVRIAGYRGLECEKADGNYYAVESGWRSRGSDTHAVRFAVGAWMFDPSGVGDGEVSFTRGAYMLVEANRELPAGRSIGVFFRAGGVHSDCQPVDRYLGGGVRLASLFASRPGDVVSLGIARARIEPRHRVAGRNEEETTIELTWVARMNEWMALQPDIQYIASPAGTIGVDHALVGGVRLILTF